MSIWNGDVNAASCSNRDCVGRAAAIKTPGEEAAISKLLQELKCECNSTEKLRVQIRGNVHNRIVALRCGKKESVCAYVKIFQAKKTANGVELYPFIE